MNAYERGKERARATAQEWQRETSETAQSYGELLTVQAYFERLARRYGLTAEFKENGII